MRARTGVHDGPEAVTNAPATPAAHYDRLLAEHYAWMVGDYATTVAAQRSLLEHLGAIHGAPGSVRTALDLGAGPGYQSVALAEGGCRVTAIDSSAPLLAELESRRGALPIEPVLGDMRDLLTLDAVQRVLAEARGYDVAVCMGDTLTHLERSAEVERLFADVHAALAPGGVFVLTFRDLTAELTGLDRFIPVRSDPHRVMMCFLEYEPDSVVVHDLVHVREGDGWALRKSSYRKLRLAPGWVAERLAASGFAVTHNGAAGRLAAVVATRHA